MASLKLGNNNWATKEGKLLSYNDENNAFKPIPLDFERSTTKHIINRSGVLAEVPINVAAIDFSESETGALLFEPQRTNLLSYSNDFSNSIWNTFRGSIVSNYSISPDGTNNASFFKEDNTNNTHVLRIIYDVTNGLTYSFSVFAKKNLIGRNLQLNCGATNNAVNFNLQNGTIISSSSAVGNITEIGNYYRCEITASVTNGNDNFDIRLLNNTSDSYLGDGVSGIDIYGVNIEEGDYCTSYIPTSGSTVTRTADISSTSGLSSVINSVEGVFMVGIAALANSGGNRIISLSDGSNNSRLIIYYDSTANKVLVYCRFNNGNQAIMDYTITDVTVFHKVAVRYRENDYSLWINGVERDTDTAGLTFPANTLNTFSTADGNTTGSPFFGKISELVLTDYLTNTQMEELTTI